MRIIVAMSAQVSHLSSQPSKRCCHRKITCSRDLPVVKFVPTAQRADAARIGAQFILADHTAGEHD